MNPFNFSLRKNEYMKVIKRFNFFFRKTTNIHSEKRKKAAKMLVTLVIVFFVTNLPVHLFNILVWVKQRIQMNYLLNQAFLNCSILNDFIIADQHKSLVESVVVHGQVCHLSTSLLFNDFSYVILSLMSILWENILLHVIVDLPSVRFYLNF